TTLLMSVELMSYAVQTVELYHIADKSALDALDETIQPKETTAHSAGPAQRLARCLASTNTEYESPQGRPSQHCSKNAKPRPQMERIGRGLRTPPYLRRRGITWLTPNDTGRSVIPGTATKSRLRRFPAWAIR